MKKLQFSLKSHESHWVGDGFPVRSMFTYNNQGRMLSPFLMMDYAGPYHFEPSTHIRGVGEHPHRGFETVTIVYSGEVEHRDSSGGGGLIGPGDVQWMTAASGLVHTEKHGADFAKSGGEFEMVQLWVNLPKKDKMSKPRYQGIKDGDIPLVISEEAKVRVIAGEFEGTKGPASTFTAINLWDIRLKAGKSKVFTVPEGHTAAFLVLGGKVKLSDEKTIGAAEIAVLETEGSNFQIEALEDAKILFLGGEVINEPIVGYGPFVMNTMGEIQEAFNDYQSGRMGTID